MNENEKQSADPQVDMMFAAAEQFFANIMEGAEKAEADQAVLDRIQEQAGELARYRTEDSMLSTAIGEARKDVEELRAEGDEEAADIGEKVTSWLIELRDRRRQEAHHYVMASQGGGCGGCEGCSG